MFERIRVVSLAALCAVCIGLFGSVTAVAESAGSPAATQADSGAAAQDSSSARQDGYQQTGPSDQVALTQQTSDSDGASTTHQFAQLTASWVHTVRDGAVSIGQTLTGSNPSSADGPTFTWHAFFDAAFTLFLVVAATLAVWLVLRVFNTRLFGWLEGHAGSARERASGSFGFWTRFGGLILAALVTEAVGVVVASAVGGAVASTVAQVDSQTATRGLLFVNAFFLIEMLKAVVRAVFSPRFPGLRPSPMSTTLAGWWSIRLRWLIGWLGYGIMVVVPILETQISSRLGALAYLIVCAVAFVTSVLALWGYRQPLTATFTDRAARSKSLVFGFLYRLAGRLWLSLTLAYLTVVFLLTQLPTPDALAFVIRASIATAVVMVIGWIGCRIIDLLRQLARGLGGRAAGQVPQMERQIDRYVPIFATVAKFLTVISVIGALIGTWHIVDLAAWLYSPAGSQTVGSVLRVLLIAGVAAVFWIVTSSLLEFRLSPHTGQGAPSARQQTLIALLRNVLAVVIATLTAMIALSQIGVNIGPLIASAGILGLAVGFGAQTLVQDVIAGVFIQLESSMNVGDVVSTAGLFGTVERLTIRSSVIRDLDGAYHVVPFSASRIVSNYMREGTTWRGEYAVALGEDIDAASQCLREAFDELKNDPEVAPNVIGDIDIAGVSALEDNGLRIRAMITTVPGTQWGIGRAFNRLVKNHFDQAGIEIPFPHQTLYFGNNTRHKPETLAAIQTDTGADASQ